MFDFQFTVIDNKELRFSLNDNQALWFKVIDKRDNSFVDGVMIDYFPHEESSQWFGRFDDFIDQDLIPKVSGVLKKVFSDGSGTPPDDVVEDVVAQLENLLRYGLVLVNNNTEIVRK